MNPISVWRLCCVYLTSICMLGGGLQWAFFFTFTAQFFSLDAYAVDQLKNELDAKYQLDTPRNVDGNDVYQKLMDNKDKGPSSSTNLEVEVLSKSAGTGTTVDTSGYNQIDFHKEFKKYMGEGISAGKPKVPTMTNGNIDVEYYEKAGTTFTRDETGNLIINSVDVAERGEKISGIKSNEVFTNQQQRSDEEFNAPGNYGDEKAYVDDLKVQYNKTTDGKTMNSEAYRAIMKANADNPSPKIKSGAYFFSETNKAISDAQAGEGIWSQSCVDTTTVTKETKNIPIWEPSVCQRPNHQNLNSCVVTRHLETNKNLVKKVVSAKFGHSWGHELTVKVDFGKGTAQVASPSQPAGGTSGVVFKSDIEKINLDLFCVQNPGWATFVKSTDWPSAPFGVNHDTSITTELKQEPTCDNGMVAILYVADTKWNGGYQDDWDLTAEFKFEVQTSAYTEVYTQSPEKCADQVGWKPGPYPCESESCYKPKTEKNNFCTFDEWETVEQDTGNYPQWAIESLRQMYPEDPNPAALYGGDKDGNNKYHVGTWKINAKNYSCDPLKGNKYCAQLLNEDTQKFEEQCFNYEEFKSLEGSCKKYEKNSSCEKTGDSCAEGWYDQVNGICFMYTDNYRCDVSTPFDVTHTTTSNVCAGMLPCLGNDCAYGEEEQNEDFEKAVLMGSIAQTVDDDSQCATEDPTTCVIFPGEEEYCSWEVSGMGNNCCEAPSGVDYLEMAATGYKMMQNETFKEVSSNLSGGYTDKIGGLYNDFTEMLVNGWNTASTAVVDFASSIMGDPEFMKGVADSVSIGGGNAAGEALTSLMHSMQQQLYTTLNNLLPDQIASMLFQEATDEMVEQGAAQAGDTVLSEAANQILGIISFIGLLYTIYNLVNLLANILTQCDENEQDMGVRIAQKQCFSVGDSYCAKETLGVCYLKRQDWCCYSSMLSRIIADQGSKQLGKDMASCPGFTVDEFSRLDFDKLDLSEWLSTMYQSDILSSSGYDIEKMTGDGRMFGNLSCEESNDTNCEEMHRKNANERAQEQFEGDASGSANELKNNFDPGQIDCSVFPRPMICELGG
jgi:hypothetical protein